MNPVLKEGILSDVKYTVAMTLYVLALIIVIGLIFGRGFSEERDDFFCLYLSIFAVVITACYCCSKAKMDRFFDMGLSRKLYQKQCLWQGVIRSVIMATAFTVVVCVDSVLVQHQMAAGVYAVFTSKIITAYPPIVYWAELALLGLLGLLVANIVLAAVFCRRIKRIDIM
jgi:hypothetical protein